MTIFRSREGLIVKVFYQKGDEPFICAVNGMVTLEDLVNIEDLLRDEHFEFGKGNGDYVYAATYYSGQFDEFGNCEHPSGWELSEIPIEPHKYQPGEKRPCICCGKFDCGTDDFFERCMPF